MYVEDVLRTTHSIIGHLANGNCQCYCKFIHQTPTHKFHEPFVSHSPAGIVTTAGEQRFFKHESHPSSAHNKRQLSINTSIQYVACFDLVAVSSPIVVAHSFSETSKSSNMIFRSSIVLALVISTNALQPVGPNKKSFETFADGLSQNLKAAKQMVAPDVQETSEAKMPVDVKKLEAELDASKSELAELNDAAKDPVVAATVAGSALGIMAGSPLFVGAALGVAGSKILEDDKKREQLEKLAGEMGVKLQDALEYAKAEIEKEEDPSKIPEKLLQLARAQGENGLQSLKDVKASDIMDKVKDTVESEEFQKAPGRFFNAVKTFLESEEVKSASASAVKAIKTTVESEEAQKLKARATKAIQSAVEKNTAQLRDVKTIKSTVESEPVIQSEVEENA